MEGHCVVRLFPLSGELERTEWIAGIIVLHDESSMSAQEKPSAPSPVRETCCKDFINAAAKMHVATDGGAASSDRNAINFEPRVVWPALPPDFHFVSGQWTASCFMPFDLISLRPVDGTLHRLLPLR